MPITVPKPVAAEPIDRVLRRFARAAALVLVGLLVVSAIVVTARRLSGAFERPLAPPALAAVGLTLAASAAALRWLGRYADTRCVPPVRADDVLVSVALVVLAAALVLPGADPFALLILWGAVAIEEVWAWRGLFFSSRLPQSQPPPQPVVVPSLDQPTPDESDLDVVVPGDDVLQQLTLSLDAEGRQQWQGWLRMPIEPGQRTGALHVAFCPPLAGVPEVDIEQVDGPECRVTVAQALPFGVRLELKLSDAAEEPDRVVLRFAAVEKVG